MKITLLKTYYGQVNEIQRQIDEKIGIPFVVVDDGHPNPLKLKGCKIIRIKKDIPWNQATAKNLGASKIKDWIIIMDADHIISRENIEQIKFFKPEKGYLYYLNRTGEHGEYEPPSINCLLIHRDDFDKIKYDEEFSGHYGYEDCEFDDRARIELKGVLRLPVYVKVFYSGATKMERDTEFNYKIYERKRIQNEARARARGRV